jgi:isoamylase
MAEENWGEGFAKSIAVFLNGRAIAYPGPRGERIVDDSFLIFFNAHYEPIPFKLLASEWENSGSGIR